MQNRWGRLVENSSEPMGSLVYDKPRQLVVPAPYSSGTGKPISSTKGPDTIRALREKLNEFKNENTLLGSLVKELKAERDGLSKKITAATKQLLDANSRAANASAEHQAACREQQRLQKEVERLSAVVHSHSVRLQKSKQRQQELEDVALDLRQQLDDAKSQLADAQHAEQQAQQRCTAAEAKVAAAGLGAMPKMGPTAEQLVINSTQRIRELTEELAAAKAAAEQQQAALQQQLQQQEQHWQQQVAAVQQQLQQSQQAADQFQQQQQLELQRQSGRLSESEQQVQQLQHMLVGLQANAAEGVALGEAKVELQRLKQDMLSQTQSMQQQVLQLQAQLADAQLQHAGTVSDQQQQIAQLERKLTTAQNEKQELIAALIAVRQQESVHRIGVGEVTAKLERLRGQLVNCVGELQVQMDGAAAASQQHTEVLQQLRAMEATAAAARAEAAETRQQLVELASVSIAELRAQVAGESVAITGLPEDTVGDLPMPVTSYIKVLEHAVCDCEQRCQQLLADTLEAQQQERKLRTDLSAAREQQAATQRALTQQTQRLLAAERMRLSDLRETQGVEKRLLLAQQECWTLRDALLAAKSGTAAAAAVAGAVAAVGSAAGSSPGRLAAWCAPVSTERGSTNADGDCNVPHQLQSREGNQQQLPEPRLWAVAAADAAAMHASTAAAAKSAASKHHSKLEQLRQLKQQMNHKANGVEIATLSQQRGLDDDELPWLNRGASGGETFQRSSRGPGGLTFKTHQQQLLQQTQAAEQHAASTAAAECSADRHPSNASAAFGKAASFEQAASQTVAAPGAAGAAELHMLSSGQTPAAVLRHSSSFKSLGQGCSVGREALLKQTSCRLTAVQGSNSTIMGTSGRSTAGQQNEILSPKELEQERSAGHDSVCNVAATAAAVSVSRGACGGGAICTDAHQLCEMQLRSTRLGAADSSIAQPATPAWMQQQEQQRQSQQQQWRQQQSSLGGWIGREASCSKVHSHGGGAAMDWQRLQAEVMQACSEPFDAGAWHV